MILPTVLPGHWTSADGLAKATEYSTRARADLAMPEATDLALANELYLANGFLPIQTAAKERMRWLSVQLAISQAALRGLIAVRPANWDDDEDPEHQAAWSAAAAAARQGPDPC